MNRKALIRIIIGAVIAVLVVAAVTGIILAIVLRSDDSSTNPTVQTKSGNVKGKTSQTSDGSTIYEFFNIPYASAPTGVNRFQPPQLKNATNPWGESVDATVDSVIKCIQLDSGSGSEDCLVMTIRTTDISASKPVIVWIHGGGMMMGYCCDPGYSFDSDRTTELEAVTVNINYRLGILGFNSIEELWDEDAGVYANNGIRDQIAALDWIQDNIAGFGGDPNSVTIIGESGGATAVLGIVSSPLAVDKFHRAISLSPAPEMRFNYTEGDEFQQDVYDINTALNCTQDNKVDRKACLMEVSADQFSQEGDGLPGKLPVVTSAYFDFPLRYGDKGGEYAGLAIIDPTVITQSPRNLGSAAEINPSSKVKVIMSNTAQETGIMRVLGETTNVYASKEELDAFLTTWYPNITSDLDILNKTYEMYPDTTPQMLWETLTTDMRSTCPTNDVAMAMSGSTHHDIYRLYITNVPADGYPSYHAWDTFALFNFVYFTDLGIAVSDEWNQFGDKLVELVKEFAKDGSFSNGWGTFPNNSMTLTSSIDEMEVVSTDKPQEVVCEALRALDLVKYGWQN